LGVSPATTKPAMSTFAAVPTWPRVERLRNAPSLNAAPEVNAPETAPPGPPVSVPVRNPVAGSIRATKRVPAWVTTVNAPRASIVEAPASRKVPSAMYAVTAPSAPAITARTLSGRPLIPPE